MYAESVCTEHTPSLSHPCGAHASTLCSHVEYADSHGSTAAIRTNNIHTTYFPILPSQSCTFLSMLDPASMAHHIPTGLTFLLLSVLLLLYRIILTNVFHQWLAKIRRNKTVSVTSLSTANSLLTVCCFFICLVFHLQQHHKRQNAAISMAQKGSGRARRKRTEQTGLRLLAFIDGWVAVPQMVEYSYNTVTPRSSDSAGVL